MLTVHIQPLALIVQKLKNFSNFFIFSKLFVAGIDFFFPSVDHWFQLIFTFVCFNDQVVLVEHSWLKSEEGFNVFRCVDIESVGFKFNLRVLFFFGLLYIELFFNIHLFRFRSSAFSRFSFFFFLLFFFLFRNLSFLKPLFNQTTLLKGHNTVFSIFDLEGNTEGLLFWILRFGDKVSNMLSKAIDCWLVFDQNFDGLFASKLDCFACGNFSSGLINEFSLFFMIARRI